MTWYKGRTVKATLVDVFARTIASLDPGAFVHEALEGESLEPGPVTVIALGKAAVTMVEGARSALGARIYTEVVVAPAIPVRAPSGWMESDHPSPGVRSQEAAKALLRAVATAQGPIVALISGGGSALAALPATGLKLSDVVTLVEATYAAGADIHELNIVRKHLSAIKGGRLAQAAGGPITTLLVSDVVGDIPSSIASGPTCADPSTFAEAVAIVERYCPDADGPALQYLRDGACGVHPETLKGDRNGDRLLVLAGMRSLVEHARDIASESFSEVFCFSRSLEGDVEAVANLIDETILSRHGGGAHEPAENALPGLWIAGGEATISLCPTPGEGGRAQHLALLLAGRIRGRDDLRILVAGSDGADGNSAAAGAIVDGSTWQAIERQGIAPGEALSRCDAGAALGTVGAQITTGPTGVNHADLVLVELL